LDELPRLRQGESPEGQQQINFRLALTGQGQMKTQARLPQQGEGK